ncbi:putative protein phosphatase 2C 1 [Glycine soja]
MPMDEDQWRYDFAMSQEVDMDYDYDNQEECGVNERHVDCSNAFNTSQVFTTRDDVLQWARTVAHENGFVAVIMRSDTETGSRGRSSFVLIGCERSGTYKCKNKEFVRKDTGSRKCGCPFRLRGKPVRGGEGWMVKLICGIHNHELAKSLVGHPYAGRLTKEEKKIIADMTKSMVKPKNILLTLKEHNADSYTTIKQIYNARSAYRSSIRGADTEMQHLMKLLERDQYIHWHRLKDEVVVRDLFWCHPDAVKLCNACHLVFFIDSTYKTNRYRLPLLDFVGVTPTAMTFSAGFAYLEAERVNNIVWALERFRGLFLRHDRLPLVIVTDRDLALMNAVKTVFPESTNLLCRFHIDKNVKAKCKSLIGEKNAWDYVMDNWGTLVDCPSEYEFHESYQKFQVACSPWPMFVDYVNDTWIIPHKEKFITAWTNKVMHLGNTTTNRVESAHWALKRVLQNSVGDLCSVWDAMNNMITLQHVEIKASFETSTHVVGHVYKKTLYKRLLGMVSRDALNQIASEIDRLRYLGNNLSSCGCVMRSTHGLPCACELSRYTASSIPLESVHLFWRRLCFSDQGLCETEVTIKEEIEVISKRFDELDVAGKVNLKSKLREIAYPDHNSMCPPPSKVNTKGAPKKPMKRSQTSTKRDPSYWEYVDAFHSVQSSNSPVKRSASCSQPRQPTRIIPMLDQFASFFQGFIRDVVDVKADGNCGYRSIGALLGMGEDSWPLVRNELLKELGRWSHEYMNLFGGTERFEQLKLSLLVDGFSKVSVDKWMDITDMGYVIASRYNVILVSLSQQQSMTFFPLRSQPPPDSSGHRIICVGHVFGNHFVQVYLKDHCPLPPPALLWSTNCYSQAKQWAIPYISRMQEYTSLMSFKTHYIIDSVDVTCGLSLGEYTALAFAGAFSFEDGLKLVKLRGEAMQDAANAAKSAMVSVIGLDSEKVQQLCDAANQEVPEAEKVQIANYLCPGNYAVSGGLKGVEVLESKAKSFKARMTVRLAVAGAFHTSFMKPAVSRLEAALATTEIRTPRIPVISNVNAQPHTDPDSIKKILACQVTSPVQWETTVQTLLTKGLKKSYELGPGKVIAGIIKRRDKGADIENIGAYWAEEDVDPSLFPRELLANASNFVGDEEVNYDPQILIRKSHAATSSRGSATVSIVAMLEKNGTLKIANHYFDCPFQLSSKKVGQTYLDAAVCNVEMIEGDTIVMGFDGIFDNVFYHEIVPTIVGYKDVAEAEALTNLASRSRHVIDSNFDSPYSLEARSKLDDITVIIGQVMDEDQWRYDYAMSQEVHMDYDYDNEEECVVNEPHVFGTRDDVLQWARTVAHENGFVVVIMRFDTETSSRGRSSFVLIGCERSGAYKCKNTGSRKCGCPFRLRGKPVHGGKGWMVKLIYGIHNHELAKSLVGHPYAGRLTKEEKKIIADMTKSMVKPKNILLMLKEHNANSCTTIKQIYNARSAYRSSIRGADTEM